VLHHLPGEALRSQTIHTVKSRLAPRGILALSVWQFLNSERLRGRIQPWESAGLLGEDVDPGDFLLDWRQGGRGLRYAHHFSEEELTGLALRNGFTVVESFLSDGEGGKLGLYQLWRQIAPDV